MSNTRIESEALQLIYKKWLNHHYSNDDVKLSWGNYIDRVNLGYSHGKAFDEFVWSCGGHIRQENSRRYLEFFNDEDAIMFLLRWG
jgi:hypothetical protein